IAAEAPAEEAVSEDINVEDIAVESPAEEAVSEDINVEDIAAEAPAEEAVSEDVNVEDITAEAPAEESVSEDVNVENIAAEAPVEEAVSEDINVEDIVAEAPAEEAVSEDINVEEIAAEPPAEEAVSEDVNVEDIAAEAPAEDATQDPEEQEIDVGDLVQNEGDDLASPADEISGEESALLDAMGNQDNPTEDVQADVVETEAPAEGSGKVDEVVDDEIDLEVLLRPVETEGGDDLVQNEPVEESSETQSEEVATETLEESAPEQDETATAAIGEAGEAEISEESASDAPVEETVAEESQDSVSGQDEVVSWEVPQDEYDVVSESGQNDSVKEAAADLAQLEARIGSAGHYMDPQAESDLMNMLGDGISPNENDLVQNEETAFSPEEISRMINGDTSQADVPDLQKVSNTIGPITANADLTDQATLAENISEGEKEILTPKEHQYYVDELNLARLYFETGDTEEAIKIIEDVQEHGSLDLKKEASKVMEAYGS
ncbi:FimV/HubP family polar landmark protein, partial [Succinivibrio sp.]|uniref:FimV/HubP family polar landmark protein n=1 Tax=Succinivibrio sp. TaxID=2053619 RepID=UPI003870172C